MRTGTNCNAIYVQNGKIASTQESTKLLVTENPTIEQHQIENQHALNKIFFHF